MGLKACNSYRSLYVLNTEPHRMTLHSKILENLRNTYDHLVEKFNKMKMYSYSERLVGYKSNNVVTKALTLVSSEDQKHIILPTLPL